jgi:hypothetical protein
VPLLPANAVGFLVGVTYGKNRYTILGRLTTKVEELNMAIYGIGAYYTHTDVSADFVNRGVACVGWEQARAPAVHRLFEHIKTGDIIYIKTHPPEDASELRQ